MKLNFILCHLTNVSDLSPLKGMPLTVLVFGDSHVSDLSPLRGMPLKDLNCVATKVFDLTPLEGMNLTKICFTPKDITKGIDVIRQMKSITTIGTRFDALLSPDEFWKKYDAGEFGKP